MNLGPPDPIDRTIDEVLASMVEGEPRRVSAASVRQAMGGWRSRLPLGLAAAAVLIMGVSVALMNRAPAAPTPVSLARSVETLPVPAPDSTKASPSPRAAPPASGRAGVATTTEPRYEGLPRLTIATIDLPEPLVTGQLAAEPIRIPGIEIAPLSVSSLSHEQENK